MRNRLDEGVQKLCELYPQLSPNITFSEHLSQHEVNVFTLAANGHLHNVALTCRDQGERDAALNSLIFGSSGIPLIKKSAVDHVQNVLFAASSGQNIPNPIMREVVSLLKDRREVWWSLHNAYEKIVTNDLVGSCPIVMADPSFFERILPFASRMHRFQEFHKVFHMAIHHVLEKNDIKFANRDVEEGVVTYLHESVMGKKVRMHYHGVVGERFVKNADKVRKVLDRYPRTAVIPMVKRLAINQ